MLRTTPDGVYNFLKYNRFIMADQHYNVLIIGGGTAGIMTAAQLLNARKSLKVGIVEPSEKHYYQPAWTLVGAGDYDFKKTERDEKDYIPKGADWIKDRASRILPEENEVRTESGGAYTYDYLLVAPGVKMDLDALPGLKEALEKDIVCSNYVDPQQTWRQLQRFKGGQALFTQVHGAIKCGGAPQKAAYLADDYFRKSGVRDKTTMVYAVPGSVVFGVSPYKETIEEVVKRKEFVTRFFYKLLRIDAERKVARYALMKPEEEQGADDPQKMEEHKLESGEVEIPFDFMHLAPPQSPPAFVQESVLAIQDGPGKGFLDVDIHTLQHKQFANVFGAGDSANLPTAKTGAAVRKQVPVLVQNILNLMDEKVLGPDTYEGYSSCPLVTGYGKMVLAEFKYDNVRDSDPLLSKFVDTSKEQYSMWLLKKYGLPFLYWNRMLKGKM